MKPDSSLYSSFYTIRPRRVPQPRAPTDDLQPLLRRLRAKMKKAPLDQPQRALLMELFACLVRLVCPPPDILDLLEEMGREQERYEMGLRADSTGLHFSGEFRSVEDELLSDDDQDACTT